MNIQNTLVSMTRAGGDRALALACATVSGRSDRWFFLNAPGLPVERACRADSCLVEPDYGDTVLLCHGDAPGSIAYIVAVLARAQVSDAAVVLPGGVALHTECGALRIDASRIGLNASDTISVEAPAIGMTGLRADVQFARMNASLGEMHARLGVVSTVAKQVTSTVGRLVQKARDSFRRIDGIDETRAGRMRMKVDERLHVTAQHASVLADGHVKIDGDKIDLG